MTAPAVDARGTLRQRLADGDALDGVFVKTPTHQVIEVLAAGPDDLAIIDTEHAAIGPTELDAMLAVAHALDFPCLVRVAEASRPLVQQALDAGATGVVVPHVDTPELAADVVRWSRYGAGGRGFSGSTRSAGWGTATMAEVIRKAADTTIVVIQIEDAVALNVLDPLCAVPRVDVAFVGAADLAVALGGDDPAAPDVRTAVEAAIDAIAAAAGRAGLPLAAYAATPAEAATWRDRGVSLVCTGSDQSRIRG